MTLNLLTNADSSKDTKTDKNGQAVMLGRSNTFLFRKKKKLKIVIKKMCQKKIHLKVYTKSPQKSIKKVFTIKSIEIIQKRCPKKVFIKSVFTKVSTNSVHKKCPQKCPQNNNQKSVHKKCKKKKFTKSALK